MSKTRLRGSCFRTSDRTARTKCRKTSKLEWVLTITQKEITARTPLAFFARASRHPKTRWETVSPFRTRTLPMTTVSLSRLAMLVLLRKIEELTKKRLNLWTTGASITQPTMWRLSLRARMQRKAIILRAVLNWMEKPASSCWLIIAEWMPTRSRERRSRL